MCENDVFPRPPQQKNKKADFKNFFWKQEKKATNE